MGDSPFHASFLVPDRNMLENAAMLGGVYEIAFAPGSNAYLNGFIGLGRQVW